MPVDRIPTSEMTLRQRMEAITRCRSEELRIFEGEVPTLPLNAPSLIGGTFPQYNSQELAALAASIPLGTATARDRVGMAYSIMAEAEMFCRNLEHWNDTVRRSYRAREIADALAEVPSLSRKKVLMLALNSAGYDLAESVAEKAFSEWFKEHVRYKDFIGNGPYNAVLDGNPAGFNNSWLNLPDATEPPTKIPPRKLQDGEHLTAPWWHSASAWWPDAPASLVAGTKRELFKIGNGDPKSREDCFIDEQQAASMLAEFLAWFRNKPRKDSATRLRAADSKQFIDRRTKGAGRKTDGRFGQK